MIEKAESFLKSCQKVKRQKQKHNISLTFANPLLKEKKHLSLIILKNGMPFLFILFFLCVALFLQRPHTPVSVATEPSPPPSTESSVSETVNENVSEGQWLLSRSEGQIVAGLQINEGEDMSSSLNFS